MDNNIYKYVVELRDRYEKLVADIEVECDRRMTLEGLKESRGRLREAKRALSEFRNLLGFIHVNSPSPVSVSDEEIEQYAQEETDGEAHHIYQAGYRDGKHDGIIQGMKEMRSRLTGNSGEADRIVRELVRLKNINDILDHNRKIRHAPTQAAEYNSLCEEYKQRNPLAWEAARKYVAENPADV